MPQTNSVEKERELLGRNSDIKKIDEILSKNNFAAVLGGSGLGRSAFLKHFVLKNKAHYIDLRKITLSPENFAVEFIGNVSFLMLGKNAFEFKEFQNLKYIKQLKIGKRCTEILSAVENELEKIKPNQELLVKSAFLFTESLAMESGKKSIIALNNFEETLKLNNFSQVKGALDLFFNTIEKNSSCSFLVSSSSVNLMRSKLKKFTGNIVELSQFSLDDTRGLFERIAGKTDERVIKEVYALSAGIPTVIRSIATRFKDEKTSDAQKNINLVKYILISDITTTNTATYNYCSRLLTTSLNRARGESLLRAIVKAVSENRALRLTEIAKLIYRSGPVTKSLLERLIEVDLIVKKENTFDFSNPVLKLWCRLTFRNIEFSDIPTEKELTEAGGLE